MSKEMFRGELQDADGEVIRIVTDALLAEGYSISITPTKDGRYDAVVSVIDE